jgi:hypothetical protein
LSFFLIANLDSFLSVEKREKEQFESNLNKFASKDSENSQDHIDFILFQMFSFLFCFPKPQFVQKQYFLRQFGKGASVRGRCP